MANPQSKMPNMSDLKGMWEASGLREKILFTIGMIALYRFGAQVPVWGVDASKVQAIGNQLLGFLDMFSGGALTAVSVMALGIGPYITASIVMQLLTVVIPKLEELQKEGGEAGRKQISQYTRYMTVGLALLQSVLVLKFVGAVGAIEPGLNPYLFYPVASITLMTGALFALWLAEIITERGIGNGGSLLIFVSIIAGVPVYISRTAELVSGSPERSFNLLILLVIFVIVMGLIIILQEATRKILIVSAKKQVGNKIYGGQNTHIPFKINPASVMPVIFAFAVLSFPAMLIQMALQNPNLASNDIIRFLGTHLVWGAPLHMVIEFVMIVFFTFFYASIIPSMQPREIADNLKKYGSSIPGVKPGRPTAELLEQILTRITFIGAFGLAFLTVGFQLATSLTGINTLQGLGVTSLIIMVGVALDTVNQIRVHLLARQYEGFLK